MKSKGNSRQILYAAAILTLLTSCITTAPKHRNSSVVQYLYPDKKNYVQAQGIPRLELPLRVGIVFVPENTDTNRQTLTERDKMELMGSVGGHFKKYDFVKTIELIPSVYLRREGSFTNLDQIRTMYGIDVIALLSYDQTQFTDERWASITYWTLIGAYIIPGEQNATHTMVDASIFDIRSRKMLFRAPGINYKESAATPVNLSEQLRLDSIHGFKEASIDLIKNLEIQLDLFKEKIKETPDDYQITHKQGYTGGGSLDASYLIILALVGGYGAWLRRNQKI